MTSFFDWLGRVIFLVLAGMVTLSLIGALAAIPAGVVPARIGIEQRPRLTPEQPQPQPAARPQPAPDQTRPAQPQTRTQTIAVAPAPPEPIHPARWLETITYALLALVGLAALGCLLLWRGLRDRRRIASALEALVRARP